MSVCVVKAHKVDTSLAKDTRHAVATIRPITLLRNHRIVTTNQVLGVITVHVSPLRIVRPAAINVVLLLINSYENHN